MLFQNFVLGPLVVIEVIEMIELIEVIEVIEATEAIEAIEAIEVIEVTEEFASTVIDLCSCKRPFHRMQINHKTALPLLSLAALPNFFSFAQHQTQIRSIQHSVSFTT